MVWDSTCRPLIANSPVELSPEAYKERQALKRLVARRKRERSPLGQVRDAEGGRLWDVYQVRETKHGFDLLFGFRVTGCAQWGLPRLITTQPLVDYWEANKTRRDCVIYDLPAGRTTLKRVRHRLGFHLLKDQRKFWADRIQDLAVLSSREFAARHNVDHNVATDRRFRMLGRQTRELDWWQKPEILAVLQSGAKRREISAKLGIGLSHAGRLRSRARNLQQSTPEI